MGRVVYRFLFCLLVCTMLCNCTNKHLALSERMSSESRDVEAILNFLRDNRWGFNGIDYVDRDRYLSRKMHAYMYVSAQYIDYLQGEMSNTRTISLPDSIYLDFDYLLEHVQDTVVMRSVDSLGGLPLRPGIDDRSRTYFHFSPKLPTTSPDHFVVAVQMDKPRDPYRYIFVLLRNGQDFSVLDYFWNDGPRMFIPLEEDLLMRDFLQLNRRGSPVKTVDK